jgi:hypothetical protein
LQLFSSTIRAWFRTLVVHVVDPDSEPEFDEKSIKQSQIRFVPTGRRLPLLQRNIAA